MWTVKTPALYEFDLEQQSGPTQKVYKTPVATWMGTEYEANWTAHSYVYTFDPIAASLTKKELPANYPVDETKYYDGVAYVWAVSASMTRIRNVSPAEHNSWMARICTSSSMHRGKIAVR